MVICLQRDADLHMAQLMPLPLTVSCFSKIQIGFTFLVPVHLGTHTHIPFNGPFSGTTQVSRSTWVVLEKGPLNQCVCVVCEAVACSGEVSYRVC